MLSKFTHRLDKALNYLDDKISQVLSREDTRPNNIIKKTEHLITRIDEEIYAIFFEDTRHEYFHLISSDLEEDQAAVEYVNVRLKLAYLALAFSTVGAFLHYSFVVISMGLLLFYTFELIEFSINELKKGKICKEIMIALLFASCIATGQIWSLSLGMFIFVLAEKFSIHLQNNSKKKLVSIFQVPIKNVWILVQGQEVQIPFSQLQVQDTIIVQAGEIIPADGVVISGNGLIDQHVLTGESQPVEKGIGDQVLASTILLMGKIYICVEKTGNNITAAKIQKTLMETTSYISNIQTRADAQADQVTPVLLGSATIYSLLFGIKASIPLLYTPMGFNMRVLGPLGMLNFLNISSLKNILIKDGRSLEELNDIDTVIFDKTGTLTVDKPTIYNIISLSSYTQNEILQYAATAEQKLTHPIAKAILNMADNLGISPLDIDDSQYEIGYGIRITLEAKEILVGSLRFMVMSDVEIAETYPESQHSQIFVALEKQIIGILEIGATIRPEAFQVIQKLKKRGLKLYILSGDHEKATKHLARELKIENYFAEILPADKGEIVGKLQQQGHKVCFVGDGINDAIALQKANISVSLLGSTTIATDCAQIVLMDKSLQHLDNIFELSKNFTNNQRVNRKITNFATGVAFTSLLFLNTGIIAAVVISEGSLLIGIANTMLPWIQFRKQLEKDQNR